MIDFSNCTFLIPFMNSCSDRSFNLKTILKYLNQHITTNVFICEQFSNKHNIFSVDIDVNQYKNLKINHSKNNIDNDRIHKTKLYNIGISQIQTEVISTYDSDVLIPIQQMVQSKNALVDLGCDYSYPFNKEYIEISKQLPNERNILLQTFNFDEYLQSIKNIKNIPVGTVKPCPPGGCMFLKRKLYIEIGMENEHFIGYAPEDAERKARLEKFNCKNKNIDGHLFHIEHNTAKQRLSSQDSVKLFQDLNKMNKEQLKMYYNKLNYKTKYGIKI